jgi:hypothetical protein
MATDPVERLRALCLALPEVTERASHGEPSFFVRDRKQFVAVDDYHHGGPHLGFWCAAPPGAQETLISTDPQRYFRPPYVGHRGWVGVRLVMAGLAEPDWDEIAEVVRDAYRVVAPKSLAARV